MTSKNNKPQPETGQSDVSYKVDAFSQGHAADDTNNMSKQDVQSQSVRGGKEARLNAHDRENSKGGKDSSSSPLDSASAEGGEKQRKAEGAGGSGNPEGIGFVEQVGSASGTANKFEGRN